MTNTLTVYKGKDPEYIKFEIISSVENNIDLSMNNGAITVVIYNTNFREEFFPGKHTLEKDTYSMFIEKVSATTDPKKTPIVTIKY